MSPPEHRYSYSGADASVYVMLSGIPESLVKLDSLHTLSVSVHEAKGQARALGYRGIKGLARGIRTIGGSLILTVIEDHPLRQVMIEAQKRAPMWSGGWSVDRSHSGVGRAHASFSHDNRLATLLPPLDILITYVSEGGNFNATIAQGREPGSHYAELRDYEGAAVAIEGVEFIDSGLVTSIHDIVSEVTLSFQAVDYKPISLNKYIVGEPANGEELSAMQLQNAASTLSRILYGDIEALTDVGASTDDNGNSF